MLKSSKLRKSPEIRRHLQPLGHKQNLPKISHHVHIFFLGSEPHIMMHQLYYAVNHAKKIIGKRGRGGEEDEEEGEEEEEEEEEEWNDEE